MIEFDAQKNLDFINQQIKELQQQKYFFEQIYFFDTCIKLFNCITSVAEDNVKKIIITLEDKFSSNNPQDTIHVNFHQRKIILDQSFTDYSLKFDKNAWSDIANLVQFKQGIYFDKNTTVQNLIKEHSYPIYNTYYLSLKLETILPDTHVNKKYKL